VGEPCTHPAASLVSCHPPVVLAAGEHVEEAAGEAGAGFPGLAGTIR
jgi:hypothetical protein